MTRTELLTLANSLALRALWTDSEKDAPVKEAIEFIRQIAEAQPVAARYGWDGDGWLYLDNGSGSDWLTRHADAEPLYTLPLED